MEAIESPEAPSLKWYEVWREVFLHPSVATFERILADPKASSTRAFLWVAVMGVIAGVIQALVNQATGIFNTAESGGLKFLSSFVCGIFVAPIAAVVFLALGTFITHVIARALGGTGLYDRLLYCMAAISAPSTLVSVIFAILGAAGQVGTRSLLAICVAPFSLAFGIYTIVLEVLALRAAERLTTGRAILTLLMPLILFIILGVLCLALLVPIVSRTSQ